MVSTSSITKDQLKVSSFSCSLTWQSVQSAGQRTLPLVLPQPCWDWAQGPHSDQAPPTGLVSTAGWPEILTLSMCKVRRNYTSPPVWRHSPDSPPPTTAASPSLSPSPAVTTASPPSWTTVPGPSECSLRDWWWCCKELHSKTPPGPQRSCRSCWRHTCTPSCSPRRLHSLRHRNRKGCDHCSRGTWFHLQGQWIYLCFLPKESTNWYKTFISRLYFR